MYCNKCGTENNDDLKFCTECGAPVDQNSDITHTQPLQDSAATTQATQTPVVSQQNASQQKKPLGLIIGAIVAVVVAIIVVLFALGVFDQQSEPNSGAASSTNAQANSQTNPNQTTEESSSASATGEIAILPFIGFASAEASSTLPVSGVNDAGYSAVKAIDGDVATAWCEGASNNGVGEYIRLSSNENQGVSGFTINNGYQKSQYHYDINSRPKQISVYCGDELICTKTLADSGLTSQTVDFGRTVNTNDLRIVIDSVYPGTKYSDCCISEIKAY